MGTVQVLDYDKGHSRVVGQMRKQVRECLQASSGGSDGYYGRRGDRFGTGGIAVSASRNGWILHYTSLGYDRRLQGRTLQRSRDYWERRNSPNNARSISQ